MTIPKEAAKDDTTIRRLRSRLGLTQEQMASRLGVSFSTVNRWEQGHTKMSRVYLVAVLEALLDATEGRGLGNQLPPLDDEAEEAVLASVMVDSEAIYKVQGIVRPEDFYREQHRWIYEACLTLWERSESINQVTVAQELAASERLEDVGGPGFLSRIVVELPTAIGVEHYAGIVRRDATYRQLIGVSTQITQLAYQGGPDLKAVLGRAEGLILALRAGDEVAPDFVHVRESMEEYLHDPGINDVGVGRSGRIRTGFLDLDTLLGGLQRGYFVVLAARPGHGKTSLALNIARNVAVGQQGRVAVFSLEMAIEQVTQRLLAAESGVSTTRLRLGDLGEPEETRIQHAMGLLADAEIYVDDTPAQRVLDIRTKARRLNAERGLDLIIVDYLQLIHGSGEADSRLAEMADITRAFKELAGELDVPLIVCAQLSRGPEERTLHTPILSDMRESGSIEQDADVVIFIYREDAYTTREQWLAQNPDKAYPEGMAQIIVAKHRNGPTGSIDLRFRKNLTRFEDIAVRTTKRD